MKNNLILAIVISLILGGGVGYWTGKSLSRPTGDFSNNFRMGSQEASLRFNGQRRLMGGSLRPINGEIIAIDEETITIKTDDGSTKLAITGPKTTYSQTTNVNKEYLKIGLNIAAIGNSNPDGSFSAQNIQINPLFRPERQLQPKTE